MRGKRTPEFDHSGGQRLDSARDAFLVMSADGIVERWNAAAERLFGWPEEEAVGRELAALILPETMVAAHRAGLAEFRRTGGGGVVGPCVRMPGLHRDGSRLEVELTISPSAERRGAGFQALIHDVSALAAAHRDQHNRFAGAFYAAPIGMALVGLDGRLLAVNDALGHFLGRHRAELLDVTLQEVTDPDDVDRDAEPFSSLVTGEIPSYDLEKRYLRPDGTIVWGLLSASLVRDCEGLPSYVVCHVQDVTDAKRAQEDLRRRAEQLSSLSLRDGLTNLPNRRDFIAAVDRELQRARRHGSVFSVVVLDVKAFTAFNRDHGFTAGDQVLRDVGAVLREACRASDVAGRIGGAAFGLLMPEAGEPDAHRAVQRIRATIEDGSAIELGIGIASFPDGGESSELMLVRAQMALEASKTVPDPGTAEAPGAIGRVLTLARSQLRMPVAYLAEHTTTHQHIREVSDGGACGVEVDSSLPLAATYCSQMLEGALPHTVPDTTMEPSIAHLDITREQDIRAYVGVPVRLSDGRLYGTLCTLDTATRPDLGRRDAALMEFLAGTVAERIEHDEQQSVERRAQAEISSIHSLLAAVAARDSYTSDHSHHVVELAEQVAVRLGLPRAEVATVQHVAVLHDVGKVGIPDAVLQKRGPLTAEEWDLMRQHPAVGARILEAASSLAHLAPAVRAEHERWDGGGYPDGLRGPQIPIASRITLACDAYHAMTSDRPYRQAMSAAQAAQELQACAGTQFDPDVVEALLSHLDALAAAPDGLHTTPLPDPAAHPRLRPNADHEVRCECLRCGSHLVGTLGQANLTGVCSNCGSYEVRHVAR